MVHARLTSSAERAFWRDVLSVSAHRAVRVKSRLAPGRVRPCGGGQDLDNNSREVDMARDPKPADEPETDAGVLGSEPGGADELGSELGGTDVLGPEEGGTDELGPEEGGTDVLGPEAGGTDVLRPPGR